MRVYNIGSLNIDYVYAVDTIVRPGETVASAKMEQFPGGKGLNQSVALARAGASVIHAGFIGRDGTFLADILNEAGADTTFVETADGASGHAIIQVEASGQNSILLFPGANYRFTPDFIEQALADAQPGDILLLQNEINDPATPIRIARQRKMQIALNPSPFNEIITALPLDQIDWFILNEIEGAGITGKNEPQEIVDALLQRYPACRVVLTLGADGALYADREARIRQAAFPTKAVDTTACGDTFTGFLLASVAAGKPIAQAMHLASLAASITASRMGASVSIPTLDEVLQKQ